MKLDTVRTVPSMYSPFLGLASPLFLDPAIYPSPIHTSPDVCLSSGPASTLPKALASRLWRCPFPGTFFIAHTLPQVLWPQVLGRLLDHSLFPQWALLAHYLQPQSPWCKEFLALSPAVPISENRLLPYTVETGSGSTLLLLTPELKQVSTTVPVFLWLVFLSSLWKAFGIL